MYIYILYTVKITYISKWTEHVERSIFIPVYTTDIHAKKKKNLRKIIHLKIDQIQIYLTS